MKSKKTARIRLRKKDTIGKTNKHVIQGDVKSFWNFDSDMKRSCQEVIKGTNYVERPISEQTRGISMVLIMKWGDDPTVSNEVHDRKSEICTKINLKKKHGFDFIGEPLQFDKLRLDI